MSEVHVLTFNVSTTDEEAVRSALADAVRTVDEHCPVCESYYTPAGAYAFAIKIRATFANEHEVERKLAEIGALPGLPPVDAFRSRFIRN